MNPRWNAVILMVLGTVLTTFSYLTSLVYVQTGFQATLGIIMTAFGMLTVASGVVLAYLHFYREPPDARFRR